MGKLDKFKQILGVTLPIAGMVPGLSAVTKVAEILNGFPNTPASPASAKAFEEIASINDRQDEMFFTMAEEIASLKARITKLENK